MYIIAKQLSDKLKKTYLKSIEDNQIDIDEYK